MCLVVLVGEANAKKVSATGVGLGIAAETKMFPGDHPAHEVALTNALYLDSSADPNFNNSRVQHINVSDYTAGSGEHWGHRKATHPDGDVAFGIYEGTTVTTIDSKGRHTTFKGTWTFTGGTGKFSGASGSGTYSGRITAEGLTYEWEGEYELE
jgi:hypothetical protein